MVGTWRAFLAKWFCKSVAMLCLSALLLGCVGKSPAISTPSTQPLERRLSIDGAVSLDQLQVVLAAEGVTVALQCDPSRQIFCRGDLTLGQVRSLIEVQTGYQVLEEGSCWRVVEGGKLMRPDVASGTYVAAAPDEIQQERIGRELLGQKHMVSVEFWLTDGSVTLAYPLEGAGGRGEWEIANVVSVVDSAFNIQQEETTYFNQYAVIPQSSAVVSSQSQHDGGLIIKGSVAELGLLLHLQGTFEISALQGQTGKSQKAQSVDVLLAPAQWLKVGVLDQASATLALKPFGISASLGRYALWVRVSPVEVEGMAKLRPTLKGSGPSPVVRPAWGPVGGVPSTIGGGK